MVVMSAPPGGNFAVARLRRFDWPGCSSIFVLRTSVAIVRTRFRQNTAEAPTTSTCFLHRGGVWWCIDRKGTRGMAVKKRAVKANQRAQPRTSVTFPHDLYQTIEEMA